MSICIIYIYILHLSPNTYFHYFSHQHITQALRVDVLRVILAADAAYSVDDPAALLSSVQNFCWLMIIVDYTTQYIRDLSHLIGESLVTNQDSME